MREPFTRRQQWKAWLIGMAGYFLISVIGRTLRWQSQGDEHLDAIHHSGHRAIFTFWHGRIFSATYYWRKRGIVVMTSMNRDGEAIAQCIQRFGFGTARGSSSRGGFRALAEMAREIRRGRDAGFTIDGPRGPRYVAKPGPIHLARLTGAPIFSFYVAAESAWILRTWDAFILPKPFSRVHCYVRSPIRVDADANHQQALARMQSNLETAQRCAEARFGA